MKPLNPTDVTWLAGTMSEIEELLHYESGERMLKLGHVDDVRSILMLTANNVNVANLKPLLSMERIPAAFVLIQGRLFGLITLPAVKA